MVKLEYSALYTDNLGCEKATVYFLNGEFKLKVRGCTFKSDNLNFDFYSKYKDSSKIKRHFYMKDDELIEYVVDVKIPLVVIYNNVECEEEFLLRVERHKNYYNNSLSFYSKGIFYQVEGHNLVDLLMNMEKELPSEYNMECCFSCMLGAHYLEEKNKNNFYCLKSIEGECKDNLDKKFYVESVFKGSKKDFKKLQKVPITYVCDDYCLS
jgi:hypothetical protein